MIKKELLEILCCPACKGDVEYKQEENTLVCTQCRTVYAIKDDIPIMLTDDSTGPEKHDE